MTEAQLEAYFESRGKPLKGEPVMTEESGAPQFIVKTRKLSRILASQRAEQTRGRYRGVRWHYERRRYAAHISIAGVFFHIGDFLEIDDAIRAFDNARWWTQEYSRTYPRMNRDSIEPPSNRTLNIRAVLYRMFRDGCLPCTMLYQHKHEGLVYRAPKNVGGLIRIKQ